MRIVGLFIPKLAQLSKTDKFGKSFPKAVDYRIPIRYSNYINRRLIGWPPRRFRALEIEIMMKPNEVSIANLEQLTDELAAAGWDSTQTNIEDAREAVLNLIAENMVAFLVSKGWAVDETTTLEGAKQMAQFQSFLDGTL